MINFRAVTKKYLSGHTALDEISFDIEAGEFVFILGTSGSGKTTLLRLILREIKPSSGQILVAEHDLNTIPHKQIPHFRRQIGSAFQDFKLLPDKSAFENVQLALDIIGTGNKEINSRAEELLSQVGLEDKMYLFPSQLSGGEIQRVAIARALATDPVLLFADEPTGNLDPETSVQIINLLKDINEAGTTVIMATHDLNLANSFGYRQLHLHKGNLVKDTHNDSTETEETSDSESDQHLEPAPKSPKKKKKKKTKKD